MSRAAVCRRAATESRGNQSLITPYVLLGNQGVGRGCGVGRERDIGLGLGVAVGVGVGVGLAA